MRRRELLKFGPNESEPEHIWNIEVIEVRRGQKPNQGNPQTSIIISGSSSRCGSSLRVSVPLPSSFLLADIPWPHVTPDRSHDHDVTVLTKTLWKLNGGLEKVLRMRSPWRRLHLLLCSEFNIIFIKYYIYINDIIVETDDDISENI